VTTATKPTVRQGKLAIDEAFNRYMDGKVIDPLALDVIGYAVANDVQLRDYLLGYGLECGDIKNAIGYINHLIEQGIQEGNRHAFYTVLATLHLQNDDRELAQLALDEAIALKPNYALTTLLVRVLGSGWSTPAFRAMTYELHPKVLQNLVDDEDKVIEIQ
jgi:hypothetical protein